MAKKRPKDRNDGSPLKKSTAFQQILCDLESPDEITRANAVRELCPCRTGWGVPVQRYVVPLREDPSSSVRHEVQHVLHEDSRLGARMENDRLKEEVEDGLEDGALPIPHSMAWRRPRRPHQKGRYYARPLPKLENLR